VLLHILLEGPGFVAAVGGASVNEQEQGKVIAFPLVLPHAANNYSAIHVIFT